MLERLNTGDPWEFLLGMILFGNDRVVESNPKLEILGLAYSSQKSCSTKLFPKENLDVESRIVYKGDDPKFSDVQILTGMYE
jgi:hypothetical protein